MRKLALFALIMALATVPVLAEQIIYFTNGTSMPIRGHIVEEETIKVDLGDDSFMAFPMSQVDRIEKAGQSVYLNPSRHSNQMVTGPQSTPVQGRRPAAFAKGKEPGVQDYNLQDNKQIKSGRGGVAVYHPYTGTNTAKSRLAASGHAALRTAPPTAGNDGEGIVGTRRVGSKNVIDGPNQDRQRNPPTIFRQAAAGSRVLPKAPPEDGSGGPTAQAGGSDNQGSEED